MPRAEGVEGGGARDPQTLHFALLKSLILGCWETGGGVCSVSDYRWLQGFSEGQSCWTLSVTHQGGTSCTCPVHSERTCLSVRHEQEALLELGKESLGRRVGGGGRRG